MGKEENKGPGSGPGKRRSHTARRRFDAGDFPAPSPGDAELERLRTENAALQKRVKAAEEVLGDLEAQLAQARDVASQSERLKAEINQLHAEKGQLEAQVLEHEEIISGGGITRLIPAQSIPPPAGLEGDGGPSPFSGDAARGLFAGDPDSKSNALLGKIGEVMRQAQELRAQVVDLCAKRDRLATVEPQLHETERQLAAACTERDNNHASLRQREKEMEALRKDRENDMQAAAEAHERLTVELTAKNAAVEALKAKAEKTAAALDETSAELTKARELGSTLQQSLASLQERNKAMEEELSGLRPRLEKIEAELRDASAARDTTLGKLEGAQKEVARLSQELAARDEEIKRRDAEIEKLTVEIKKTADDAQAQVLVERDERERLNQQLAEQTGAMGELRGRLESVTKERDSALADLRAAVDALSERIPEPKPQPEADGEPGST
jgi:chromosome segregation ATPase